MPEHPLPERLAHVFQLFEDAPGTPPTIAAGDPVPYSGQYRIRGRWLTPPYAGLRNAAWAVRNTRVGARFNPLALRLMLAESEQLIAAGEPIGDVLEAYAELLLRP
jgi:hypothetical protein